MIKFISKTNHKYLESWCCSSDTLQCCRNCRMKTSPPPDSQLFAVVLCKPQEGTKHKQKAQAPSLAAPSTSLASLTGSVSMKNIHSSEQHHAAACQGLPKYWKHSFSFQDKALQFWISVANLLFVSLETVHKIKQQILKSSKRSNSRFYPIATTFLENQKEILNSTNQIS